MRVVPIESVREGCHLARNIFDNDGRVLLREGAKLTNNIIRKIKELNIYSIYIIDEYSQKEIEDIIKPELRQKAVGVIRGTFFHLEANAAKDISSKNSTHIKEREQFFSSIREVADNLIEELLSKKNLLVNLVDIKSMDNYTYQHCVNVAVLSLILGIQLQLNKFELTDLCIGALVHDIGKILIPKELTLKPGKLTDEEFNLMKNHTTKGYEYLRSVFEVSAPSRVVALEHHEHYNGNGYPEKRTGTKISKLARIVAIADVYDALTSDRPYRRAMSPNDALEYIMAGGASQFDYEMVKAFAKVVVPYPEGTIVKLSNGDCAVVEEIHNHYPLRPLVKIVKSSDKIREGTIINLVKTLHLVIVGPEYSF
jgi:HD-GYP domain-containing protein (c-di-GMP phosphodiesterase class II)